MKEFLGFINFLIEFGPEIVSSIIGVLTALIALFAIIPGPEPERTLHKWVDYLSKFSRK